jgi:SAM-dependent methyltransferase
MLDAARVSPGDRFLDLGCGAGGASISAKARGAVVSGLDASDNLLAIARERVPEGRFEAGELEELPYADGEFDVVFAANAIQYAEDQTQAVREAMRVTRPGGTFVIGMWCEPERCGLATVMKAVGPLMPPPPEDQPAPPPTLSAKENLLALLERGGARPTSDGEVECTFRFPDEATMLRGLNSAGIIVGLARAIGQDRLNSALAEGMEPFRQSGGDYAMSNWFRWVTCSHAA